MEVLTADDACWRKLDVFFHGSEIYDAQKSRVRPAEVNLWLE